MTSPISRDVLVGTWRLEAFDVDDGQGRRPWRPPASGLLLYGADGMMSVAINGSLADTHPTAAVLFYAGRFTLAEDERGPFVTHHVEQSTDPLRMGKSLRRDVRLEGELLHLHGERPDGLRSWLRWRRI